MFLGQTITQYNIIDFLSGQTITQYNIVEILVSQTIYKYNNIVEFLLNQTIINNKTSTILYNFLFAKQ